MELVVDGTSVQDVDMVARRALLSRLQADFDGVQVPLPQLSLLVFGAGGDCFTSNMGQETATVGD